MLLSGYEDKVSTEGPGGFDIFWLRKQPNKISRNVQC